MAHLFKNVEPSMTGAEPCAGELGPRPIPDQLMSMIDVAAMACGDNPRAIASLVKSMAEMLPLEQQKSLNAIFAMMLSGGRETSHGRPH